MVLLYQLLLRLFSPKIDSNPWLLLPTVLLIFCLASMIYSVLSARPRASKEKVTLDDVRANRANILFFGNFYTLSRADYVEGLEELIQDSERLYDTMARDLHGLGVVLGKKYKLLRAAYNIFMIGFILSVLSFIFVFFQVSF